MRAARSTRANFAKPLITTGSPLETFVVTTSTNEARNASAAFLSVPGSSAIAAMRSFLFIGAPGLGGFDVWGTADWSAWWHESVPARWHSVPDLPDSRTHERSVGYAPVASGCDGPLGVGETLLSGVPNGGISGGFRAAKRLPPPPPAPRHSRRS